jgi:hypothetical protein
MSVVILILSFVPGCSIDSPPIKTESRNENTSASPNNPSPVAESDVKRASVDGKAQKTLVCDEYQVVEDTDTNSVKIVSGAQILHTIKLLTDKERNGFAFDGAKKTEEGFELAVEYGTRIFYRKNFIFICRDDKFYLNKIEVDSFDRQNPDKSSKEEVIRVQPNLPLKKFSLTDFMLEGVVKY